MRSIKIATLTAMTAISFTALALATRLSFTPPVDDGTPQCESLDSGCEDIPNGPRLISFIPPANDGAPKESAGAASRNNENEIIIERLDILSFVPKECEGMNDHPVTVGTRFSA